VNPPNFTLVRIEEVRQLAREKLTLVQTQISSLESEIEKAKVDQLTEQLASVNISPISIKMVDVKPEQPESSSQPSPTSAWEQWCNARFASRNKAPMDIDGQGQTSSKVGNFATAPVSNLDCKDKAFIESMIQEWHAWTKTQKMLQKEKVSWSDLALRLTWGFRGNLNFWWERVSDNSKLRILQHDKPVNELCKAVVHEFYGDNYVDTDHNADLFMSQRLCDLNDLHKYFCTMQNLLYKLPDPTNKAYLRKYISSLPNPVPDLVRKRLEDEDISLETLSIAGLQEQVVQAIQEECIRRKNAKALKKRLGLKSSACELFETTASYGCSTKQDKKTTKKTSCHVLLTNLRILRNTNPSSPERNFFLRKEINPISLGVIHVSYVISLATGRHSVLCGQKLKLRINS
jgi:hypothetical protein